MSTSSKKRPPRALAPTDVAGWWRKSLADLSSTRIQLTYLVTLMFVAVVVKGLWIARSISDVVALGGMLTAPFIAILTYHMAGKLIDQQAPPPDGGA